MRGRNAIYFRPGRSQPVIWFTVWRENSVGRVSIRAVGVRFYYALVSRISTTPCGIH